MYRLHVQCRIFVCKAFQCISALSKEYSLSDSKAGHRLYSANAHWEHLRTR